MEQRAYKKKKHAGRVPTRAGLVDGGGARALLPGKGVREGLAWRLGEVQGLRFFGSGGVVVGARGSGRSRRSKFRNVSNAYKKKKNSVF